MKKIELNISEADLKIIKNERKSSTNEKVRSKAEVIFLRANGKTLKEINEITSLAVVTIITYIKSYVSTGINSLYTTNYKGQKSKLNDYKDLILSDFNTNPPSTLEEAKVRIEKLTNLKRSTTQIRFFLKKTNFLTKKQEALQQGK